MTSIGLITLQRQAAQAACEGDAGAFADLRASIETLDRMGEISREELDLLQIVAAARRGDTELARHTLLRMGTLSDGQQQNLFKRLTACPEMVHARFREFVTELGTLARAPRGRAGLLRSRTLSLVLGGITMLTLAAAVVLIEFLLPRPAAINARNILTSVGQADTRALADSLPRAWRDQLRAAAVRLANAPADPALDAAALPKALRNLQLALLAAHASPRARQICALLVGADEDASVLKRLAAGVSDIAASPWMNPASWKSQPPWESAATPDAALVIRTLLAHAPLAQWTDRLFDSQERIVPLETSAFFVTETSQQPPKTLLEVQGRATRWPLTAVQVDGVWVPADWAADWQRYAPWITGTNSPAFPLSQLQNDLSDQINGVASWLTRCANSSNATLPAAKEVPWWIAQ